MAEPDPVRTADPLAAAVRRAVEGDRQALDEVCRGLQDPLYRLALRMLADPDDAADATQEVLVLVITNLSSFQGRSKLLTWAYTIATRHILQLRRTRAEQSVHGPEAFATWLDTHRAAPPADLASSVEFEELCGEVRIGCPTACCCASAAASGPPTAGRRAGWRNPAMAIVTLRS